MRRRRRSLSEDGYEYGEELDKLDTTPGIISLIRHIIPGNIQNTDRIHPPTTNHTPASNRTLPSSSNNRSTVHEQQPSPHPDNPSKH